MRAWSIDKLFQKLSLAILCLFLPNQLSSIGKEHVPLFNPQAPQVLYYETTKNPANGALKLGLLQTLQRFFDIELFIETGTFMGHTTAIASQVFQNVITIELFSEFYNKALARFANCKNVSIINGDSGEVLHQILPSIHRRALFYLDGHFDGGNSGQGKNNTPIIEELSAIRLAGKTDSIILIDDICDFQKSLYPHVISNTCFANYPDLVELIDEILKINPNYRVCILGNALLAYPETPVVTVSEVASACILSRLSYVQNLFPQEWVENAEYTIANSSGEERNQLIYFYQLFSSFEQAYGWQSYGSFWYGLMLYNSGKSKEAYQVFQTAASHSLPGWRVRDWLKK